MVGGYNCWMLAFWECLSLGFTYIISTIWLSVNYLWYFHSKDHAHCCTVFWYYILLWKENLVFFFIGKLLFLPRHRISSLSLKISLPQTYLDLDFSILFLCYSLINCISFLSEEWFYFRNIVLALLNKYGHFCF